MNIQQTVAKVFISHSGRSIISFAAVVVFARELPAAELGIFFLYQMFIGILSIPGSFGRGNALIKRLSEGKQSGDILSTSIVFLLSSSIFLVLIISILSQYINRYIGAEVALLIAVGIVLRSTYTFPINILKGELRVEKAAALHFWQKVIWLVASYLLLQCGQRYLALIYGLLLSYIIISFWGIYITSTPLGEISIDSARSLFKYWKYTIFSYIDSTIYSWADIAVIGLFLTQAQVGIYEVAWRVSIIVVMVSSAIESVILPQISAWDASDSKGRIEDLFPNALFGAVFLAIPAFFGSILLAEPALGLIFGPEYRAGSIVLIILVLSKIVESIDKIIKNFIEGINLPNLRMRAVIISITLNIVFNLALVWLYGLVGAAIATTVAFASSTLMTMYYLSSKITINIPYDEIIWCVLSSFGMFLMVYIVKQELEITSITVFLAIILLGVITYFGLALLHKPIRNKTMYNLLRALEQ